MSNSPVNALKMILRLRCNRRALTLLLSLGLILLLMGILMAGSLLSDAKINVHFNLRNLAPSGQYPFGTDWLGRDMFTRTFKGLSLSMWIGMIAAAVSTCIALALGMAAATLGKAVDSVVSWLIDFFLGVPHLVAIILIAFMMGGGSRGIIIGVAVTHWPSLARVIRAEVLQLLTAEFVQVSRRLGRSRWWIAVRHILPHLLPQFCVGLLLLFPHAILHEASITFLGFGLSPHQPAIGVILSESMRYLSTGKWWLAFFPGLSLLVMVRLFGILGENLRLLIDPHHAQE